jgi:hypothetical protein
MGYISAINALSPASLARFGDPLGQTGSFATTGHSNPAAGMLGSPAPVFGEPSITNSEVSTCMRTGGASPGFTWQFAPRDLPYGTSFAFVTRVKFNASTAQMLFVDNTGTGYNLRCFRNSSGFLVFAMWVGSMRTITATTKAMAAGTAYTVACVVDYQSGPYTTTLRAYVDGVQVATGTWGGPPDGVYNGVYVGRGGNSTTTAGPPNAYFQGFAIFDRALSASEIQGIHNGALEPPPAPISSTGATKALSVSSSAGTQSTTPVVFSTGQPQALAVETSAGSTSLQDVVFANGTVSQMTLVGTEGRMPIPSPIILDILDDTLNRAPTSVTVTVDSAVDDSTLTFAIDGTDVATLEADSNGSLGPSSIPVASTYGAGQHTLSVTDGDTSAEAPFWLERDAPTSPRVVGPDAAPVAIPGAEGRYVLQDLMPGGLGSYVLPISPARWDGALIERTATATRTTSVHGPHRISGGTPSLLEWTLAGYCPDQAMHAQLEAFGDLNRRLWLIDHRGRAWKVAITDLRLTPRKRQLDGHDFNDWAHDYEMQVVVFSEQWETPA